MSLPIHNIRTEASGPWIVTAYEDANGDTQRIRQGIRKITCPGCGRPYNGLHCRPCRGPREGEQ